MDGYVELNHPTQNHTMEIKENKDIIIGFRCVAKNGIWFDCHLSKSISIVYENNL